MTELVDLNHAKELLERLTRSSAESRREDILSCWATLSAFVPAMVAELQEHRKRASAGARKTELLFEQIELELLRDVAEVLRMYADPESYHAIAFMPDKPCGAFADDFSNDHGDEFYDRPMPGKAAREVLTKLDAFKESG